MVEGRSGDEDELLRLGAGTDLGGEPTAGTVTTQSGEVRQ
jgi:hypothetical protein